MKSAARAGSASISPVLVVRSVEEELSFLQSAFQAQAGMLVHDTDGATRQAEVTIGDSVLYLQRASQNHPITRSVIRIQMEDVPAAYELALQSGAAAAREPGSMRQEDGLAGVRDPAGNTWWIAPRNRRASNAEIERRLSEQRRQRL
jgi:PhnB protein